MHECQRCYGELVELTVDDIWQITDAGGWYAVVSEVPWISVPKTAMNFLSKLVLHSLRNNQSVQVVMHQLRQIMLLFPCPCYRMCCSILNTLQFVHDLVQC